VEVSFLTALIGYSKTLSVESTLINATNGGENFKDFFARAGVTPGLSFAELGDCCDKSHTMVVKPLASIDT